MVNTILVCTCRARGTRRDRILFGVKIELEIVTEETLLLIEFNQVRLFGTFKFEFCYDYSIEDGVSVWHVASVWASNR